jgi:hypothetical protein
MKKQLFNGKLRFRKMTIHTLNPGKTGGIKGGTGGSDTDDSYDVCVFSAAVCSSPCNTYGNLCTAGNCASVPRCPTASLITRCATGGLCIPTYTCMIDCIA